MQSMGALRVSEAIAARRVLVVDDEVLIRLLIAEALRDDGCEVTEAASADEALAILTAAEEPDVLVTDIRMPGRADGLDLATKVRRTHPEVKILVASGNLPSDGARFVADGFLAKPFGLCELVERVRELAET